MRVRLPRRPRGRPRSPEPITPAEQRVLDLLRLGSTNNEIAEQLGISPETVKTHVSSMLTKLDLESRKQLAAWAPTENRRNARFLGAAMWRLTAALGTPRAWIGQHSVAVTSSAALLVLAGGLVLAAWTRPASDEPAGTPAPGTPSTNASTLPAPPPPVAATATPQPVAAASPAPAAPSPLRPAWTRYFGGNDHEEANAVAVGPDGSVYVTGYTLSRTFTPGKRPDPDQGKLADIFIVKYDALGRYQWGHVHGADRKDVGNAVAVAPDGSVYVVGSVYRDGLDGQENAGESDALLMKYSPEGQRIWTRLWGTEFPEWATSVAIAKDGSVIVAGATGADGGHAELTAFSPDGRQLWATRHEGGSNAVAIGSDGSIYTAGEGSASRFTGKGKQLWIREAAGPYFEHATGVAVFGGAVFVGGSRQVDSTGEPSFALFLRRFDMDGNVKWTRDYTEDGRSMNTTGRGGGSVAASSDGHLYVLGDASSQLLRNDGRLVAFTLDGRLVGARAIGNVLPAGVAVGKDRSIYVTNVYTFDGPALDKLTLMKFLPR